MNKVILVGRSLAVDRRYKQEGQPEADFFNIVAWGRQAEVICQYLGKGRQIALTGRLQSRSYEAQDGTKRYVTEVVMEEFDFIGNKSDTASQNSPVKADEDLGEDFHLMADDEEVPF